MKILMDGLSTLMDNWQVAFVLMALIVIGGFVIRFAIQRSRDVSLSPGEYFSLEIAGWMIPASLLSVFWYILKVIYMPPTIIIAIMILVLVLVAVFIIRKIGFAPRLDFITLVLVLASGVFVILRFAFISKIILPLYFDSAQHYLYIRELMEINRPGIGNIFSQLGTHYYHLGFHTLTAFISATLNADIKDAMLVLGQIILALIPLSLFFIVKQETGSNLAGICTVLLAGFGWYMPIHAVEWGKYPALASLPLIQFTLSIAYLIRKQKNERVSSRRWLYTILALSIITSIFFHSRSLVIFGLVFLAWTINTWQKKLPRVFQVIIFLIFIAGVILQVIFIQRQEILRPLLDPYLNDGVWITVMVLALFFFAAKYYSDLTFACASGVFMLIGSIFVPLNGVIPGYGNLTLLDRPFVEMILYLPLSLLGGLGLAGLCEYLQGAQGKFDNIRLLLAKYAGTLFTGLILINASVHYEFYPSDCCSIVGRDDLIAIDWMDKNLPPRAHILISTTELMVLPSNPFQGYVGGDAGIWIPPLINRRTFTLPYDSNFGQQNILEILCKRGIDYIYVGETGQTFNDAQIKAHPAWYNALLSMPKAGVYQVIGCD